MKMRNIMTEIFFVTTLISLSLYDKEKLTQVLHTAIVMR